VQFAKEILLIVSCLPLVYISGCNKGTEGSGAKTSAAPTVATDKSPNEDSSDRPAKSSNETNTRGSELTFSSDWEYQPKLPPLYPSAHDPSYCLDLNGSYDLDGWYLAGREPVTWEEGTGVFKVSRTGTVNSLEYQWNYPTSSMWNTLGSRVGVHTCEGYAVYCDQGGMDFLIMKNCQQYEWRFRVFKTDSPGTFKFGLANAGVSGIKGTMTIQSERQSH
jgi:hypothetical protein